MKTFESTTRQRGILPAALQKAMLPVCGGILAIGALMLLATLASQMLGVSTSYWYLSRSSALVAYGLLWASLALGVSITNKLARFWPGGPAAFDLHQYFSFLGLGFVVLHVVSLLGDAYSNYSVVQLLLPFASEQYRPLWVGLGQLGLYLLIPVTISFYARKRLGARGWRTVHGLSYLFFGLTLLHAIFSGTDSGTVWTTVLYAFTGASLLFLTVYRVLWQRLQPAKNAPRQAMQRSLG